MATPQLQKLSQAQQAELQNVRSRALSLQKQAEKTSKARIWKIDQREHALAPGVCSQCCLLLHRTCQGPVRNSFHVQAWAH